MEDRDAIRIELVKLMDQRNELDKLITKLEEELEEGDK